MIGFSGLIVLSLSAVPVDGSGSEDMIGDVLMAASTNARSSARSSKELSGALDVGLGGGLDRVTVSN